MWKTPTPQCLQGKGFEREKSDWWHIRLWTLERRRHVVLTASKKTQLSVQWELHPLQSNKASEK